MKLIVGLLCLVLFLPGIAFAQEGNHLVQGLARTVAAPFEIPKGIFQGVAQPFFPFGILSGALTGTFRALGGIVGGVTEMAQGVAPIVKLALPFLL